MIHTKQTTCCHISKTWYNLCCFFSKKWFNYHYL